MASTTVSLHRSTLLAHPLTRKLGLRSLRRDPPGAFLGGQSMLEIMRRGQRWLLWVVIVLVGGTFAVTFGIGGSFNPSRPAEVLVEVDGRRYDGRDLQRVRQNLEAEYRRVLGDNYDAEAAGAFLDQSAADILVSQAIFARDAEAVGIGASDAELRGFLRAIPGYTDESGRLDQESITNFAERRFGSVRRFQEELRDDLLRRKVARLLTESVWISDTEAREALRFRREQVEIAFVALDTAMPPADLVVSDEEVRALIEREPTRIETTYAERKAQFERPERVRARHILVRIPANEESDPEEAKALALERTQAARERIVAGEDFADVALEISEDPGSKQSGGDLGFFGRGRMVPAFEEAAFGLEVGVLSEPVESPHGFHLIRVDEKQAAEVTALEEASEEIARDLLAREAASRVAQEQAEKLRADIEGGKNLVEAARDRLIEIERPDPIRRSADGFVAGIGPSEELQTALFALTSEAPSPAQIFEVGSKLVLVELLDRSAPTESEIAAELTAVRQQMLLERRAQLERAWVDTRRKDLAADGKLYYDLSATN